MMKLNSANSASAKAQTRAYFAPRRKLAPAPVALSNVLRLSVAVILVSAAALLKWRIDPFLSGHAPFLLFFSAVVLSTWLGGLGAGLLSVVLSALFSFAAYSMEQSPLQAAGETTRLLETLPFMLESVVIVALIHLMKRAQSQSALQASALQASEDRYRRVLDTAFEGIWIVDAQGRATYCNPHMTTLLGYSLDEMQNIPLFEFVPPEEREIAVERFQLRSEGLRARFETRLLRKDGASIWVLIASTPLFDENGAFQGSMSMLTDISERKSTEQILQQSEERYRAFVRQSSEAIWRFELDEQLDCSLPTEAQVEHCLSHIYVAECNDVMAKMFGYPNAEALHGVRLHQLMPVTEQNKNYLRALVLNDYSLKNAESQIDDAQDGTRYYETSLIGIREDGFLRRIWGMRRDVTVHHEAELQRAATLEREHEARMAAEKAHEEVQSASRAKDEFLATLSHELRTPLSSIVGWSQLLVSEKMDEETTRYALSAIERNAKLQAQLVEDLLDISRITMGRLQLDCEIISLHEVLDAAIQTVTPAALAKNIHIEYSNECNEAFPVRGDAKRLQQVAWNLLSNAIKFTPDDGEIRMRHRCDHKRHLIEFCDSGQGIAPEFLPHVFEAFRQADSSSTRSHGGVGLGLSIVKTLVDLHGGTIVADSDGPGNGATFTVTLPVADETEEKTDF